MFCLSPLCLTGLLPCAPCIQSGHWPLHPQKGGRMVLSFMQNEAHLRADSSAHHVLSDHDIFNAVPLVRPSDDDHNTCLFGAPLRSQCWLGHDMARLFLQVPVNGRLHITSGGGQFVFVSVLFALQIRQSSSWTHAARAVLFYSSQLLSACQAKHQAGMCCTPR